MWLNHYSMVWCSNLHNSSWSVLLQAVQARQAAGSLKFDTRFNPKSKSKISFVLTFDFLHDFRARADWAIERHGCVAINFFHGRFPGWKKADDYGSVFHSSPV